MIDLVELLSGDRVLLDLRGASKRQVLQALANAAAEVTGLDPDRILEALQEREKLGTTGLGEGIAIPHAKIDELPALVGFFARLARPVDFDALDDEPVDLVFLLLAPEEAGADHLKALARIARILRDPELCAALRREEDPDKVLALLLGRTGG